MRRTTKKLSKLELDNIAKQIASPSQQRAIIPADKFVDIDFNDEHTITFETIDGKQVFLNISDLYC